jgi:hypothetical protein
VVDDNKELVYDAERGRCDEIQTKPTGLRVQAKDHRRIVHLDRAKDYQPDLPGDVGELGADRPVAEPSHGGDDCGLVAQKAGASQTAEPASEYQPYACG